MAVLQLQYILLAVMRYAYMHMWLGYYIMYMHGPYRGPVPRRRRIFGGDVNVGYKSNAHPQSPIRK